ncbi:HlyD family secretion protein [Terrarubrum flagellatum]|uniref:HlyD family secretion protein n=1 Tax=Terrirubrum flagellatum TaxID=2895980 RepID=UPI003145250C
MSGHGLPYAPPSGTDLDRQTDSALSSQPVVEEPGPETEKPAGRSPSAASLVVAASVAGIIALSLWYAVRPQPLLVQGEADARRVDIAGRVDGRVGARPIERGSNVRAGQLLVAIDNPQLLTRLKEAEAARAVAAADLARILVGPRKEIVDARRASVAAAGASLKLQQQNFERTRDLAEKGNASVQRLDEATAALEVAQRSLQQARASLDEALAGATIEERAVAEASVRRAEATIATLRAQADELSVKAPVSAQVYQIGVEIGEYVTPGAPLLSLVDLSDVWLRFDLREDLAKRLKVGDNVKVRIPALNDREIAVQVKTIATRGEYAGWRATRATGDFDLRTFEVRAYPVENIPELRPGMSAYVDLRARS